ncbi:MAG: exopolysaccharide Pel transporter PelG [Sideroxydans sp.]|nr:exopolysaccharide Pel transporter PelG [Sideroxydans sp.]
MAGIGFGLRKLLEKPGYFGLFRAYLYAGIIGSGPWVLSIIGILIVGFVSLGVVSPQVLITQFQVSVTYLIMGSLIFTGLFQLAFTRFISDWLYKQLAIEVLPNFNGILLITTLSGGILGLLLLAVFFEETSLLYRMFMLTGFVVLCDIWLSTVLLSGLKKYHAILWNFFIGYSVAISCAYLLRPYGLEGLLFGFVIGHVVLLFGMMFIIVQQFPANRFIAFQFFTQGALHTRLIWIGFLYNLAVWIDKILFWYYPDTGEVVIGPLRASLIYDLPIFLAYLAIIPGMAVFIVRIETDFVEYYEKFFDSVRNGGALNRIQELGNGMQHAVRQGISEIVMVQSIAVLFVFLLGEKLLNALSISLLYLPLLYVDLVAAGLQVVFLGILNVLFYLDKLKIVLWLCILFVTTNVVFTLISLYLGAAFYGYGFALSLLVTVIVGMRVLSNKLILLEYETFMLQ